MVKRALKYTVAFVTTLLVIQMVFGIGLHESIPIPERVISDCKANDRLDSLIGTPHDTAANAGNAIPPIKLVRPEELPADSTPSRLDSIYMGTYERERRVSAPNRSGLTLSGQDSTSQDSLKSDSVRTSNFLDQVISGKNTDSLVYRPKEKLVYIYNGGDVTYGNMNMKADFMRMELDKKLIYATGKTDTLDQTTRPVFTEGSSSYTMDTILYNISSGKAKIKGVATQQGDGFLIGREVKKMADNSINIIDGKYTTCDHVDHPHYYISMTKAKVIPQKKVIIGPSYFVMEDVPLPLGVPEGFFPITQGRSSGILVPSYGEESARGFFLRDGGYYWAINDYADLTLLGSIYTYGSWEASVRSQYVKKYKFSGALSASYAQTIIGEPGDANYQNSPSLQVRWEHRQDAKANPGSNFNASVNFTTSGFNQYVSTNINDIVSSNTASSISYSRNWAGTPFSLTTSMNLNVNSRDSTITLGFPNVTFNVTKIFPFQRKNVVGKQRWYEKISMSYTGSLTNTATAKENDFFSNDIFKNMVNGVDHKIPISTSFNILNYINISPSANYHEVWFFREVKRSYDPNYTNPSDNSHVRRDTTNTFKAMRDFNLSLNASTKIYGTYDFTAHKKFPLKMLRHTITPSIGFNYHPDFGDPKFGYYLPYQPNGDGEIQYYSPYEGSYKVPSSGASGSLTFRLDQTLEAKVASATDTSGMKKVKIIDNLSINSAYNFFAKEFNLSTIGLSLRMAVPGLKNFNIQISASLDPYDIEYSANGTATRVNKFAISNGRGLGRITSVGWTTGYSFNSDAKAEGGQPAINDGVTNGIFGDPFLFDPNNPIDPALRRQMMSTTYYDFSIPWNLQLGYTFNYSNPLATRSLTQSLTYSGSVKLTENWGITLSGGFDIMTGKPTIGVFTLVRDLHCWQMSFSWVPTGTRRSWQFKINIKSASLQDLKYEKQSSYLDNIDW